MHRTVRNLWIMLSSLISWNKKMSLKKCFSNFLQVLKDQFKSWVSNFFGEGFLRKSNLKIFTIELKVEIWAKNVTLFAFPWVPNGFCWKKYLPKVSWDGSDSIKVLGKLPAWSYRQYLALNRSKIWTKSAFWGLIRAKLGSFLAIFATERLSSWCFDT